MNPLFCTDNQSDEDLPSPKKRSGNKSIRYKEDVCDALTRIGVPIRTAEVAVIDHRGVVITGMHNKHTPLQTATTMLPAVEKMYKTKEGTWHYP